MIVNIIYEPSGRAKEYCPLAVNLYKGCSHGCSYCYAPSATFTSKEEFINNVKPRKNVIQKLKKDVKNSSGKGQLVLLSFTSDPYQPIDRRLELTRKAIKLLKSADYRVQILTKAGQLPSRDFNLLDSNDCYGATLTFIQENDRKQWEPNAGSTEERIDLLKEASNKGIKTWVSLEPVIKPQQSLDLIDETKDFVDLYKIGKLNHHKKAKEIDWKDFGQGALEKVKKYGKNYYIKDDLWEYLEVTDSGKKETTREHREEVKAS